MVATLEHDNYLTVNFVCIILSLFLAYRGHIVRRDLPPIKKKGSKRIEGLFFLDP